MKDDDKKNLLASLKKVRENPDGTEDWIASTPFKIINYAFIKAFEKNQKVKGLFFDAVKSVDGKIVLYFIRKPLRHADKKIEKRIKRRR